MGTAQSGLGKPRTKNAAAHTHWATFSHPVAHEAARRGLFSQLDRLSDRLPYANVGQRWLDLHTSTRQAEDQIERLRAERGPLCGQFRDDHAELGHLAASLPSAPRLADARAC